MVKPKSKNCRFCGREIRKGHRCWETDVDTTTRGTVIPKLDKRKTKGISGIKQFSIRKSISDGKYNSLGKTTISNQNELFGFLWERRGNFSEISGKKLLPKNHDLWHWQFSHVLPKGLYKRFKLYSRNIVLMLPEEHVFVTEHEGEARKRKEWEWYFLLKDFLKQEYNARKV